MYLTSVLCALGFNVSKKVLLVALQNVVYISFNTLQRASNKEEFYADFEATEKVANKLTTKAEAESTCI
jgi:hypothetical protein